MKNRRWLLPLALLLVFIGLPAFLAWNFLLGPVLETHARYRALVGKPEADVIADLGEPAFRVTAADAKSKGIDYPWRSEGYQPVPDRPVHKEVLLYRKTDKSPDTTPFGAYVFIGPDGRVEGIDFAGR